MNRGNTDRMGIATDPGSPVSNSIAPVRAVHHETRQGEWRRPHRSFSQRAELVLWWLVVGIGIAAALYAASQT
ncbi:MAG TPA: hypothetical protein VNW46_09800 [Gemmatimonadaceae bacterium]|nr:hypothetical protein [Gemmatimonadaceae bacterium]